jgi:hypothetical protein
VGGAAIVIDVGATRVAGGVKGTAWGATKVVATARGVTVVGEAGNEGAAYVLAVGPPKVAV